MELKKKITRASLFAVGPEPSIDESVQDLLAQAGSIKTTELFFEMAKNFICVLGSDGYLKRMSRTFISASGYDETDLLNLPFRDFMVKPDSIPRNRSANYYFDTHFCCRNNYIMKVKWRAVPDVCGENTFLLGWELGQ